MKTHDFYYDLPEELIAQTPLQQRDSSRMLVLTKETGEWEHRHFFDLPEFLRPGDCLILNNSRVLPARLLGAKEGTGGACEVLLLKDKGEKTWECLVRPGRRLRPGARISFGDGALTAEIVGEGCNTGGLDILINTSPTRQIEESDLPQNKRIIDLASGRVYPPSERVTRLPSVPEKMFPITAGRLYAEGVLRAMFGDLL